MAKPAYVRHATTAAGASFTRYPSVQVDAGTGDGRVLIAWVPVDTLDANTDIVSCYAGCSASGSQAGGVAMTAASAALLYGGPTHQLGRLFYLTGGTLPTGTIWVVGDATYTDRKPGVTAILFTDADAGTVTVTAGGAVGASSTSHTSTINGTTGTLERMFTVVTGDGGTTPTAPAAASSANTGGTFYERDGAATSTALAWSQSPSGWSAAISLVMAGAAASGMTAALKSQMLLKTCS